MPKRNQVAPPQHAKLPVPGEGAGAVHNPMLHREKRLMASPQSQLWKSYAESRLRQFVTRQ